MSNNPEIGKSIAAGAINTNYHDVGDGAPVIFIHGSGPGVTAWANWRLVIPKISEQFRVIAPDMVGFGYTEIPHNVVYDKSNWVTHLIDFMDALGVQKTNLVGNSFGGAIALALAIQHPERVNRLVLMGAAGVPFNLTNGLDDVWGYTPSLDHMRNMLDLFAFDRSLVNDDLARLRYEASIRPGVQEAFSQMFPAPRQRWVDALASKESEIRSITHETLIIHGRDDQVVPLETSLTLSDWIDHSQFHIFGRCGHWTQIEHSGRFIKLVTDFLNEAL